MEICSVVAGSGEDGDNYEDGDEYEDEDERDKDPEKSSSEEGLNESGECYYV